MSRLAGLYLHIPFCPAKCHYCAFCSRPGSRETAQEYAALLAEKLRQESRTPWSRRHCFSTIFMGGGTPTLAGVDALASLLEHCFQLFTIAPEAEISVEANPGTVSLAGLRLLHRAGFNRLSLGAQSFDDHLLTRLGRRHTARQAQEAVEFARQAGFSNINLDLIYGLPGQTVQQWQETLALARQAAPAHLALYELTIEQGTVFAEEQQAGRLNLPDEDELADMEDVIKAELSGIYEQYEISNHCQPGRQCCHNINYWQNGSYLGVGAGAVSFIDGERCREEGDIQRYMTLVRQKKNTICHRERLSARARFRETVIMGLRMVEGLSVAHLEGRFGLTLAEVYGPLLPELVAQKMLVMAEERLRLPRAMLPLANQVLCRLV